MKLPVSVVVLTHNEKANIKQCMESVGDAIGEIFVVDSFSDDGTTQIASAYTDKIFRHKFENHAAQKNWALSDLPIKNDWVFFLDADERLTPELLEEAALKIATQECDGYYIARKNMFMGKWIKYGGWYPDYQLRLFRQKSGRYEQRSVHEHVILDGKTGFLKNPLVHHSDFKGWSRYFERHNIYSTKEAEEIIRSRSEDARVKTSLIEPSLVGKGPHKRRILKQLAYRFIPSPARPFVKFLYMYVYKLGFLDGAAGFHFCLLHTFYEYQITLKVAELSKCSNHNDEVKDPEYEITRPHDSGALYKYLIDYKFKNILDSLAPPGFDVKSARVLDVCCGSGMISEYYARAGAKVTGCDLDKESIERAAMRAERYDFAADFKTADATALPFGDKSFDIVSAHDGLHHIPSWQKAIAEMCRVASGAIVIVEPAKSFLTSIAVAVGFSLKYEGADFVYRFAADELSGILKSSGFANVRVKRYIMYYPHKPGFVFGKLSSPALLPIVKFFFHAANFLFGRFGNKIQVTATK